MTALAMRVFVQRPCWGFQWSLFRLAAFYLPELFPTRIRATGAGVSFNFSRI